MNFGLSKRQILALAAIGGICLIGLGIGLSRVGRHAALSEQDILVPKANDSGIEIANTSSQSSIVVHVAGCVKNPNVYVMNPGDRVIDAINKAGGAKADADLDALNLAEPLKDGEKIYVPSKNEMTVPTAVASGQSTQNRKTTAYENGPLVVNINTAGPEELDKLPGVGPATAQKIIEYRNQIGRFTSIEQLEEVRGIGPKKLEQMRPFVRL